MYVREFFWLYLVDMFYCEELIMKRREFFLIAPNNFKGSHLPYE